MHEKLEATLLGTRNRSLDFPFVWGEGNIPKNHRAKGISEQGCGAIYAVEKKSTKRSYRNIQAFIYRESSSGRTTAVVHTKKSLSSSKKTLVPNDSYGSSFTLSIINDLKWSHVA